jgi:hypothetical protein
MNLLSISTWWQELQAIEKIFWVIAILFSVLFLIQTIMSFAGADSEASGDADEYVGGDDGIGYQFFTIRNLIAFFTIFGWMGIAGISGGLSKGLTIGLALAAGGVMIVIMAVLFKSMSGLKHSGTLVINNALHQVGETYLVIPANRGGFGKVHIKVQGSLQELQAITDDVIPIATGKLVKVKSILNNKILIVTSDLS